jgi:protein-disulfide isomerase
MKNLPLLIATVIGSLALIFGVAAIFSNSAQQSQQAFPAEQVVGADPHSITTGDSPEVTIVEFSDFQCPACKSVEPAIEQLIASYESEDTADIEFVYRHFPLSNIHAHAQLAAQASEVAAEEGKFWEYKDLLFENQSEWDAAGSRGEALDLFITYMEELEIDTTDITTRIESQAIKDRVLDDVSAGRQLGVQGTPTFFVNGVQTPAPQLQSAVESALNAEQQ